MTDLVRTLKIAHPHSLFIGGEWVEPSGTGRLEIIDATTEQPFASIAEANVTDVERAIAAARRAFDEGDWPRLAPQERARYLRAIAAAILRRADEFARIWTLESGILYSISSARVGPTMAGMFNAYADIAESFAFEEPRRASGGQQAWLVREAIGVVAAIVPWNSPAPLTTYKCAPALAAGCTIVLKLPAQAPCAGYLFAEICEEVGLPAGVLNLVVSDSPGSRALIADPRVDKVSFTGSTQTGRAIASTLGQRIGRYTLELGGKSPAIVLDDHDIEAAARTIAGGVCMLAGQVCHSLTRIIVSQERHDEMAEALAAICRELRMGDPFDPATDVGPLASEQHRASVARYVEIGIAEGARLMCGGGRPAHLNKGYFFEPTVFANVENRSTIGQEEIFGPVLSVIAAKNDDEAIRIANDTIYGLNATIFTHDEARFRQVAARIRSGTVGQNGSRTDVGIAFGGFKQSGVGREGGIDGLLPFTEAKVVVTDRPYAA